ncbi:MAG: hypothetical protein GX114_07050 [Clostridiales bacterium]|nr:hypothetical protein [Clostridiales bacterium]
MQACFVTIYNALIVLHSFTCCLRGYLKIDIRSFAALRMATGMLRIIFWEM